MSAAQGELVVVGVDGLALFQQKASEQAAGMVRIMENEIPRGSVQEVLMDDDDKGCSRSNVCIGEADRGS